MKGDVEDIAGLVRNLQIACGKTQNHGEAEPRTARSHLAPLQDAIRELVRPTDTIVAESRSLKSGVESSGSSSNLKELCSLREGVGKLTNIVFELQNTIDTLNQASENSVIIHLKSFGGLSGATDAPLDNVSSLSRISTKLFSHFEREIRDIVRKSLKKECSLDMLWKIAEECYKQASKRMGSLDIEHYFILLDESSLVSPYDPDFESEDYYEHENRITSDEGYAMAWQAQTARQDKLRQESRKNDRHVWVGFWAKVLNKTLGGPTLFYPLASFGTQPLDFDVVPQYLFRTFDAGSSDKNNEGVIASIASLRSSREMRYNDLLQLNCGKATKLLHDHLTKNCFGGHKIDDNLVSWTSSLLFAIQYAVWRRYQRDCDPSDIKLCIVDTGNYPKGQFIHDIWLLKWYHKAAERLEDKRVLKFFNFRLNSEAYYNGEYLSQGAVNITGRSCVVSLQQLIEAGLFQLYPEFADAKGSERWTKRVLELRDQWSEEQSTSNQEILLAAKVARECFRKFDPYDVSCILLAFKNRKRKSANPFVALQMQSPPEWAEKPIEVRRYWSACEVLKSYKEKTDASVTGSPLLPEKTLLELFN